MAEESGIVKLGEASGKGLIDRDACMGSGNCVFWAPGVFDLDDDGVSMVTGDFEGREEEVRKAAANCPTSAIRIDRMFPS